MLIRDFLSLSKACNANILPSLAYAEQLNYVLRTPSSKNWLKTIWDLNHITNEFFINQEGVSLFSIFMHSAQVDTEKYRRYKTQWLPLLLFSYYLLGLIV